MHILTFLKNRLNKDRINGEQGFTLIELLIVIVILGILAAIAVPTYLSFVSSAHTSAAQSNVRTAIPAAEDYYETTGGGSSYTGITGTALQNLAPGIPSTVKAVALNTGSGYCVQDTEVSGGTSIVYSYAGGSPGTMSSGSTADTLETGSCLTDTGTAATT